MHVISVCRLTNKSLMFYVPTKKWQTFIPQCKRQNPFGLWCRKGELLWHKYLIRWDISGKNAQGTVRNITIQTPSDLVDTFGLWLAHPPTRSPSTRAA